MGRLDGKVAIITGAGSGIGRASALLFAQEGAQVVVADLSESAGMETLGLVQAAGGGALFAATDVRREAQVEAMVKQAVAAFGQVNILYNNAAIEIRGSATQLSEAQWDATMGANVKGSWLCSKYAIPEMQKVGGGVIINSASTLSYRVADERAAYVASKGAILQLTRSLAMDYSKDNIRANCLVIGPIDTPLLAQSMADSGDAQGVMDWPAGLGRPLHPPDLSRLRGSQTAEGVVIRLVPVVRHGTRAQKSRWRNEIFDKRQEKRYSSCCKQQIVNSHTIIRCELEGRMYSFFFHVTAYSNVFTRAPSVANVDVNHQVVPGRFGKRCRRSLSID